MTLVLPLSKPSAVKTLMGVPVALAAGTAPPAAVAARAPVTVTDVAVTRPMQTTRANDLRRISPPISVAHVLAQLPRTSRLALYTRFLMSCLSTGRDARRARCSSALHRGEPSCWPGFD